MRKGGSRDERPAEVPISEGVRVSVLKRREEGVPGRFVWDGLVRRAAEPVRMWRGAGRRDDGSGA